MTLNRTLTRAALVLCAGVLVGATPALSDQITLNPRVIPVGKWAEGIAFDGNSFWVAESGQRTIAQINPAQGSVIRRVTVGRLPVGMTFGPNGAIYAMVATDKMIWEQFPGAPQGRQIGGFSDCPIAMVTSGQHLWLLGETCVGPNPNTGRVLRLDPGTNERRFSGAVIDSGVALAPRQGKIWVANRRAPALVAIDEQSLSSQPVNLQGVQVEAIAANSAQIHAGGLVPGSTQQGVVVAVNPATMQEVRRRVVDQGISAMTDDAQHVIAIGDKGKIFVFSAGDLELQRTIDMPAVSFAKDQGPKSMILQGGNLYITIGQQFGENGSVVILSGWRPAAMPTPMPPAPAPQPMPGPAPTPPTPSVGATDCPYQVVADGDATGIWMYQDPDTSAPKVVAVPAESKGLVADRCLTTWCHVTFRNSSGWVQRNHIKAYCN